ncbi:histidine--tRNA ligase [Candidatus Pacearchaeota archaeon CG1_02_32_132]|nr:MAG: histidine--tRNA ligase [Candidatus Pacearchaeota archaeon CG1_02_32_132]
MIFEPTIPKGFQEFLPPESLKRASVKEIVEKYFKLYGFQPVETPMIEFDELMRSDSLEKEDEAISDRFRLKDRGGRSLGLRYEFTFQLARIFKQNPNIKLPFKRYQIGQVFRDEPTSSDRFKEFTQCDIDIIGDSSIETEAECLACFSDILKELKINSEIQVNNRKLLYSIIDSVKIEEKENTMRELDKMEKVGEDATKANLRKYASATQILTLFKLLEKPLEFFIKNLFEGSEEIQNLKQRCKNYGVTIKFNPFMIRGLSYYTGNIFEIRRENEKNSIGGGGRYDKSVGKYLNREIPSVGISFGLERLTSIANITPDNTKTVIISLNKDVQTINLAQKLRKSDISCNLFFGKPGKALEFADSQKIPFAIFIGEDEIAQKKVKLKDMSSGEEKLLTEKQLISKLKK